MMSRRCFAVFAGFLVWTNTKNRRSKIVSVPNAMISPLLVLLFVHAMCNVEIVMSASTIYFEENEVPPHTVLEGETVRLVCKPSNINSVNIYVVDRYLVRSGRLLEDRTEQFEFNCNKTACILKVTMINRLHAGKYWCNLPLTSLSIDVLYSPILNPVCISSSTHNTFFLKVPPEPFNFSCLSEEGNPPINMTLLLLSDKGNIKSLMTSSRHDVIRDSQSVSLTYSSALDASFDNVSLICDVYQQLPKPYGNYHDSCNSGKFVLPSYSVSCHPSYYEVSPGKITNITILCITNLTRVKLEWTNIEGLQFKEVEVNDTTLALHISIVATENESLSPKCKGYYGRRTVSASTTITAVKTGNGINVVFIVMVVIVIAVLLVLFSYLLRKKLINHTNINTAESTSDSKVSNDMHMTGHHPN